MPDHSEQAKAYSYLILADDNFDDQDVGRCSTHSNHQDLAIALDTVKDIVDDCLGEWHKPGMSDEDRYAAYISYGEDRFIQMQTREPGFERFSVSTYARARCREICQIRPNRSAD